ncbi:hypothetical protein ACH4PU_35935 [Streptomyces sp. NPDC021100]|uniref:hypothetical protein n=1 Tax=Streptomyces sp. NPDC021100 TaxID=3365114 RepID=UPI0037B3BBAC
MHSSTLPDRVNMSQIAAIAWVGRAAVKNWRRRHPDFPPQVGGTDESPVFVRAVAEAWLDDHHLHPHYTPPTAEARTGCTLTALQLLRAVMPGVLAGDFADSYEESAAPEGARAALARLRDFLQVADLGTEVAPLVLELGRLAASGMTVVKNGNREQVEGWFATRTGALEPVAMSGDFGFRADLAATEIAALAAGALWETDSDGLYGRHALATARRVWAETRAAGGDPGRARYELVLSASWLAGHTIAPAFGNDEARIDLYLHVESLRCSVIGGTTAAP